LISVTDAQTPAGVTHYDYDSESNLIRITDALGRVTRATFPSGLVETYTYDAFGNLINKGNDGSSGATSVENDN
jgi:YD repeat-containing protein